MLERIVVIKLRKDSRKLVRQNIVKIVKALGDQIPLHVKLGTIAEQEKYLREVGIIK